MFAIGDVPSGPALASIFGCQLESLPTTYLGLPLGSRAKTKEIWGPVIETFRNRLQGWKARLLSLGGRLVLLKSVLSNLPIYFLSILKAPSSVISKLEAIQNRFLWGGTDEIRKIHLVNWNMVKTPISRGGLGVLDLDLLNKALLGKWSWRFATERNSWWRELMVHKCGSNSTDWRPVWNFIAAGRSMWRWIVHASPLFWDYGYVDPGGGWVSFWDDCWVRGVRLGSLFPRVAAAAVDRNALVVHYFSNLFRSNWEIPLLWELRRGARDEWRRLVQFLSLLQVGHIHEGPSTVVWPLSSSEIFSVQSLNHALRQEKFPGLAVFPEKTIWYRCVPSKIQCFMWLSFLGRISTLDNLQARGFQLPNRCVLCCRHEESVNHLFILCPFSQCIWGLISSKLSIFGPIQSEIKFLISGWKDMNCSNPFGELKKVVLHSFLWNVWLERNSRIFKEEVLTFRRVLYKIWLASCRWLKDFSIISQHDFELWMRQLNAT
ncbi:Putative ribonuclease H protein At1g65750 [Linum perenne]